MLFGGSNVGCYVIRSHKARFVESNQTSRGSLTI